MLETSKIFIPQTIKTANKDIRSNRNEYPRDDIKKDKRTIRDA